MMPRASGRRSFSAEITSMPLPSPRRMSTTAKAGGDSCTAAMPAATESAVLTSKPRPSIARARRSRNALSSSTIRRLASTSRPTTPTSDMRHPAPQPVRSPMNLFRGLFGRNRGAGARIQHGGAYFVFLRRRLEFELLPRPAHQHGGALLGMGAIADDEGGTGALEQGLGDEDAEAEAAGSIRLSFAHRNIGLADAVDHGVGESGPVVRNQDLDPVGVPVGRNRHLVVGEIDRVLDQIPQPVENAGIARDLGFGAASGRQARRDLGAERPMRRHHLVD